ncbi:MAG: hypothetical protein JXQ96_18850 [Cyclobacteriaceae bacterium]
MKKVIIFISVLFAAACSDDSPELLSEGLKNDPSKFDQIIVGDGGGDPFAIHSIRRLSDALEVTVGYAGGCEDHEFQLIWNGQVETDNNTKLVAVALHHNANQDMCEAYIKRTLTFDLQRELGTLSNVNVFDLQLFHAYNKEEYFMADNAKSIVQGTECNLTVSFEEVICGDGFFGNRWFKSDNASLIDGEDFFYFQPVDYDLDDVPTLGSYRLGVRVVKEYTPDPDNAICAAYPGYSIPVKITCLEKIE